MHWFLYDAEALNAKAQKREVPLYIVDNVRQDLCIHNYLYHAYEHFALFERSEPQAAGVNDLAMISASVRFTTSNGTVTAFANASFVARIVVPRRKVWNPRPRSLFPVACICSPPRLWIPRLVFGFPVRAVSPSNLNQIR